ncbi:MAG TPA: phosphonate ABC transporter ATP-binding protein [Magnetospirillaceae bacterium]|jgi:phosphonate transport system ATP-binding protein
MYTTGKHLLDVQNVSMRYANDKLALNDVSLSVCPGEFVTILGSNGSGKSTLLRCIARLQQPSAGTIHFGDHDLTKLQGQQLRRARHGLAMIFQHANLVRRRTVIANVAAGALGYHQTIWTALGALPRTELIKSYDYLDEVGLTHLAQQRAGTLSGGQAQRVAISRALAQRPRIILADEPVASLDPQAAEDVMGLLRRLATEDGIAVLCVLHQPELAERYSDRIVGMRGGQMIFDITAKQMGSHDVAGLYMSQAA